MGEITVVTDKEAFAKLLASAGPKVVIVDFHATWCGPCKVIAPYFKELVDSHPNIVAAKCDVDEADDVAQQYKVEAMPTFLVFKNGVKVDSAIGGSKPNLKALFDKYDKA